MNRRQFVVGVAAAAAGLTTADAAIARRSRRVPVALVTADLESHVAVVDLASGRQRHSIPTLPGPKSIETVGDGSTALVAHTAHGAISLIDTASLRVRAVITGFQEPRYTADAGDGRHAYVTDAARGEVVTVDLLAATVAHRTRVGVHARHVTVDAVSRMLWTALGFNAETIAVVDLSDRSRPRFVHAIKPPFAAHDCVFTPAGDRVWISSGNTRRLAVYDAGTRRVVHILPAGRPPQHIAVAGGRAYVTSDDALRVHRLADGMLLHETAVPAGSYNVTHDGGRILTPSLDDGTLTEVDLRGRVLSRPTVARAAHDACIVHVL